MDGTAEGMALAQATRQLAAQKKRSEPESSKKAAASNSQGPAGKKAARARPPCTHEVALPQRNFNIAAHAESLPADTYGTLEEPRYYGPRAKSYPFILDPFQEIAVSCLERRESVLVAAHTSAGKTAVAEYAVAMAFRDKQRVIYTSPLKALSNQKFRELAEEFTDVGLLTGDVSVNPNASCIVMTTEILRSMIYRGSELLREVAWVVFDEVHYMQDRERGVVWEETIISLPKGARMVFLSATLSNASEFAGWVAMLHNAPVHVVYTDYRPTPLQHYAYAAGGAGLHLILDDQGRFRSDNFAKVRATFQLENAPQDGDGGTGTPDAGGGKTAGGRGRGGRNDRGRGRGGRGGGRGGDDKKDKAMSTQDQVENILRVIKKMDWLPVIFFSFSRRECELLAGSLTKPRGPDDIAKEVDRMKTFTFNNEAEEASVEEVYNAALNCLNPSEQDLRAVKQMLPMLKRGIAVHHSGLLPLLKEVVELLFQDGLVKALFTTETFAMGLNMPARAVVFTALRKWDGEQNRWLTSGEYIQMSGRAGRRGKDDRGIVIVMVNEDIDEDAAKEMCMGKPSPLRSSFRLSYYTMLNMMRLEGGEEGMERIIRKSFTQYQMEAQIPQKEARLKLVQEEVSKLSASAKQEMAAYRELRVKIAEQSAVMHACVMKPQHCLQFLRPGRLVKIWDGQKDWQWGVLVNIMRNPGAAPITAHNSSKPASNGQDRDSTTNGRADVSMDAAAGSSGPTDGDVVVIDGISKPVIDSAAAYRVDVLLVLDGAQAKDGVLVPAKLGSPMAEMMVFPCGLNTIVSMSAARLVLPPNLIPADARRAVLLQLQELLKKYPNGPPLLDPIEDMAIEDEQLTAAMNKAQELEEELAKSPVFRAEQDKSKMETYEKMAKLQQEEQALQEELRMSQLAKFRKEVHNRGSVLKRLELVDKDGVVTLKGKAACEIDTADELVTTELLFNGTLLGLDHASLVALVSCLIPVEKSGEAIKLTRTMAEPLAMLQNTARMVAEVSQECGLQVDPDVYVESFQPFMMDIMYEWSKGSTFAHICSLTDIYEGSIIRATRRLDELMQQLTKAAHAIGDRGLAAHLEAANMTIRRDIIFAASLYI